MYKSHTFHSFSQTATYNCLLLKNSPPPPSWPSQNFRHNKWTIEKCKSVNCRSCSAPPPSPVLPWRFHAGTTAGGLTSARQMNVIHAYNMLLHFCTCPLPRRIIGRPLNLGWVEIEKESVEAFETFGRWCAKDTFEENVPNDRQWKRT